MAPVRPPATPAQRDGAPLHRWLAGPLPEPVRSHHRARIAQPPRDRLGRLLEEWLADARIRYTYPGD